jgi:hypothetical protein
LKDRQRGLDETIKQFSQYRKDNIQLRNRLTRSFENTERNEAELDTQKIQLRQKSEEIAMLQDKVVLFYILLRYRTLNLD